MVLFQFPSADMKSLSFEHDFILVLHFCLISLLCVPALLLLSVLLRFCGCVKRSPRTSTISVANCRNSCSFFGDIPPHSVRLDAAAAPLPDRKTACTYRVSQPPPHPSNPLAVALSPPEADCRRCGQTLDAFRKQAGQPNSSSKHFSPSEAALWPCTYYVLHANEFSRRAHYIWRHLSLGEFQFGWALDWICS